MYIKSIELINVRSIKNQILNFNKGINVIIGKNNSGKSTIIKSIYKMQKKQSLNKDDVRIGETHSKLFIELEDISEKDRTLFQIDNEPKLEEMSDKQNLIFSIFKDEKIISERLFYDGTLKTFRNDENRVLIKNDVGAEFKPKELPMFPSSEDQNNFIYPYLANRKASHYDSRGGREETFSVTEDLRNIASKIQKISNPGHPDSEKFNSLCKAILGFKIGIVPVEQNQGFEAGIYVTATDTISIRSMGDGVVNILGLLVILLTEKNKLFLIEELENDIHPEALKKLLELIIEKSETNQFIITTHSNIVLKYLGGADQSKIFYTNWVIEYGEYKIPTTTINEVECTPSKRMEVLQRLGYDFSDYELYDAYLFFEESSAERIVRDILIPLFYPKLLNRIRTIAAKGVDDLVIRAIDFSRLFVYVHTSKIYYKRAWIIADGDSAGKDCIYKLQNEFNSWPKEHFLNLKEHDFEKYYPKIFSEDVEETLKIETKKEKRKAKKILLEKVLSWSMNNSTEAKKEFGHSANEIIEILNQIESKII